MRNLRIELGPGEEVIDIGMGDDKAWNIVPSANNLFIKPKLENATTNMSVVTNKHTYEFELHASNPPAQGQYVDLTYAIKFRYPEDIRAATLAKNDRSVVDSLLEQDPEKNPDNNWNYWVQGSESISPNKAFDDKRFTYLTFSNNKDMPAIYAVDESGKEALVNINVVGDVMIVHKVAAKLVMRKGDLTACVFNKSYDTTGISNTTGTISDSVQRVIRK